MNDLIQDRLTDSTIINESKIFKPVALEVSDTLKEEGFEEKENVSSSKRKIEDEIDSTDKKYKRSTLNSSFCVSPWEYRRLKADLSESQAQRIKLEDRIDELHKKNKEAVIFFDKEKSEMKSQLESNRMTIKNLEFRLSTIRKREIEYKEELNEKLHLAELKTAKLYEKIHDLEAVNKELKLSADKVECDLEKSQGTLKEELHNLKLENDKLKLNLSEKDELCASLDVRLHSALESAKKHEEIQNQLQMAHLKIKELEAETEEFKEAKNVTVALSEKVIRVSELEKELNDKKLQIVNLKQCLHSNIILEEMLQNLKTKLAASEKKENEIPNLKAKVVQLELELNKWQVMALDFTNESTVTSLKNYIESLQKKEVTSIIEVNNLNTALKSKEKSHSAVEQKLEISKIQNQKLEMVLQKTKVEIQLLRKKLVLLSRERDSYRQQLDLYEKELTLTGFHADNPISDSEAQLKCKIQNLELSLKEYKKHIEVLEEQLKQYQGEESSYNIEKIWNLKEEIKKLEDSNKELKNLRDELEKKLENEALKKEFNQNTKILHFRDNPAVEAENNLQENINYLRNECDRLRSRVQLLESGDTLDITQKVTEELKYCNSQKVSDLEKELQSANLKIQRLKEVFKKTSQEFRDVSYMLLGYRIDLASNNKLYKLYNMYSTSALDYLMFQQTKKGTLEMLGTNFAESMSKLVDEYLHKGNSIPAFLSAITLELYKLSGQSDEDDDGEEGEDNINEGVVHCPESIELD